MGIWPCNRDIRARCPSPGHPAAASMHPGRDAIGPQPILRSVTDWFTNKDDELRAADAQRPQGYRIAADSAGAGVSLRVVIGLVAIVAIAPWVLTARR